MRKPQLAFPLGILQPPFFGVEIFAGQGQPLQRRRGRGLGLAQLGQAGGGFGLSRRGMGGGGGLIGDRAFGFGEPCLGRFQRFGGGGPADQEQLSMGAKIVAQSAMPGRYLGY